MLKLDNNSYATMTLARTDLLIKWWMHGTVSRGHVVSANTTDTLKRRLSKFSE